MLPTLTVSRRTSSLMRLAASDVVSCGNTLLTVRASLSSRRQRTWNAVDGRLALHSAPLHGVSHQIAGPKNASCRPGRPIARLSNVVCKSRRRARRNLDSSRIGRYYEPFYRLRDFPGLSRARDNFGAGAGSFAATSSGPYDYKSSVIHELEIRFRDAAGTTNRDLTDL